MSRTQDMVPLAEGRVDVLATRGQERIAIEIETGKSDVVENVRGALQASIYRVVVASPVPTRLHTCNHQECEKSVFICSVTRT